jgi:hypothetical protein
VPDVYEDYKHPELLFISGHTIELDIFAPQIHVALEYHGEQHYKDVYAMLELKRQNERDKEKREACTQVFLTIVLLVFECFSLRVVSHSSKSLIGGIEGRTALQQHCIS